MRAKDINTGQKQPLLTDNSLEINKQLIFGILEEIKQLLEKFPQTRGLLNLEAPLGTVHGNPLLIWATFHNWPSSVIQLLNQGADVNVVGGQGFTALHIAANHGSDEIVKILLENRANIRVINEYGDTPLHTAVINGHIETVKTLITNGAPLDIKNEDGRTPFECAIDCQHQDIAAYISAISTISTELFRLRMTPRVLPNNNAVPHIANGSPLAPLPPIPSSFPPQSQSWPPNYNVMPEKRV